jgi:hypothetical protein
VSQIKLSLLLEAESRMCSQKVLCWMTVGSMAVWWRPVHVLTALETGVSSVGRITATGQARVPDLT